MILDWASKKPMSISEARQFLIDNLESIKKAYFHYFENQDGMPNPRVENEALYAPSTYRGGYVVLISCHYDGCDDYDDRCDNPDCSGSCEVCDMKDSWDFELHVTGELPGGLRVA